MMRQSGGQIGSAVNRGNLSSSPPLVGRDQALATLDVELERVLAGEFRVVLVTGTAGLGKTRLAAEALRRVDGRAVCLSARAYRWGGTASFGLWIEALDRYLRQLDTTEARALCRSPLASLLPSVEAEGGLGREPHRQELLEGLVDLFDRLSARQPVVVFLDDVHLADISSWEALRYLGRRLSGAPVGVIATARPEGLQRHAITGEVLIGLDEDGLQHRLALEPLRRADVTRLAHDVMRGEPGRGSAFVLEPLVSWLMANSSGHPLYVIGLLRAFLEQGGDPAAPRLERVPENLQERINLEVQSLATKPRKVLEALAVVEQRIDVADLTAITGLEMDALGQALETLTRCRLVQEHTEGQALACELTHPVVSDAVYQQIGATRRRALHRTVARTLLRTGRLGSAAGHYARAAEPGNDEAVDALCEAMAQAEARGLYKEALAVLSALLEVLPAEDPRWLRALHAMTWQSEWVMSHLAENDAEQAIEATRRMARHLAADDHAAHGAVQFNLAAFLSFGAGRLAEAEQACRAAVAAFEAAGDLERALLARAELAWVLGCGTSLADSARFAGQVRDDALRGGHLRPAVHAAGIQAYVLGYTGAFEASTRVFDQAIELAHEAGLGYRVAWALSVRSLMLGLAGRLDEALASLEAAREADRLAPDAHLYENQAVCHWFAGHLDEALSAVERAAVRRPMRGSLRRAWSVALGARLHAETDMRGRASSAIALAQATYEGRDFLVWSHWADWSAGFLAWHDGDTRCALVLLGRAAGWLRRIGASASEALVQTDIAQVAGEAGEATIALAVADRMDEIARAGGRLLPALARLGRGWAELAAGRPAAAAAAAGEAVEGLSAAGFRLYQACALELQGQALEQAAHGQAIDALSAAAELYDACGAVWRRQGVRAHLARLGSRGQRAAAARGDGTMTAREHDIATLAVAGYTAREIGERLFISRRTVETHLARIYAKLGVHSKRELVRRAGEFDLTRPVT